MEISMEIDWREEHLVQVYRAENVTCKDIERTDVTFLLDRNPKIERPLCEAFPQRCALTSGRAYDLRQRDAINWNYSEISSTSFVTDFHGRCENQRSLPKVSNPYRGRFEPTDISRSRRPFSLFDLVRIHAAV